MIALMKMLYIDSNINTDSRRFFYAFSMSSIHAPDP